MSNKTVIKAIPHNQHRYATCGDWWYEDDTLHIRVSQELPKKSQDLVILHELAEVQMCEAAGITQQQVDDFDMAYEANRKPGDESEPGDSTDAPYHAQHQYATIIEMISAKAMGVDWSDHERLVSELFK